MAWPPASGRATSASRTRWRSRIKAGSVGINMHGTLDPAMPFGGYKQSGWGREKGREVLDLYTEVKSVVMAL